MILFAILLCLIGFEIAEAQPIGSPIEHGRRVRVTILVPPNVDSTGFRSGDRLAGPLLGYDRSAIRVKERTIPWSAVAKLEYSAGRHGHAGSGALIGALVGLATGIAVGVIVNQHEDFDEYGGVFTTGAGLAGLVMGAGIGAIIGGTHHSDDWMDLPLVTGIRSAPADSSR